MVPTVLGERWRFRSQQIFAFPRISRVSCFVDTEVLNPYFQNIGLYNALRTFGYLSDANETELVEPIEEIIEEEEIEVEPEENAGLNKALDTYRKLIEKKDDKEPLTEKEQENLEKRIKEIEEREIIETVEEHEPAEIPCEKGKITIGPPTLTRFEKARIMGARALQLSLGAPPFIPIPKTARISLDIAMEELEQRVIPITIRRVLPNGDYQNIPIDYFD
jgi:DNA-directed RNA polymerase I, II, and III subunit RPABC2